MIGPTPTVKVHNKTYVATEPGDTVDMGVADGANLTEGAKSDAAVVDPTASASMVALLKGILTELLALKLTYIPQNSQSANYTTVLADAQKQIYHPGADTSARTWTIDSNADVPYPIGTAITFVNDTGAGVITIAITTDTLVLAGAGTTGSRTLAASGIATALKVTATRWMISGTGLT